jgi:hypothetical protein
MKVDSNATKAIHYCNQCSNADCKAVHKSLTKPLIAHSQQIQSPATLSTAQSLSGAAQQPMARIFLAPQQSHQQIRFHNAQNANRDLAANPANHANPSSPSNPSSSQQQNSQFNKLLGANINFIFERRYPLVQLNSNLMNQSLLNSLNGAPSSPSALSPKQIGANTNNNYNIIINNNEKSAGGGGGGNVSQQRHFLISSSRNNSPSSPSSAHQNNLSQINNYLKSSSVASELGLGGDSSASFPLPLSPTAAAAALAAQSGSTSSSGGSKPGATFSINFNRLPSSGTSSPTPILATVGSNMQQQGGRQFLTNQQLLQQLNNAIENTNSLMHLDANNNNNNNNNNSTCNVSETGPTFNFPNNLNNLSNLRYRNILFLDQVKFDFVLAVNFALSFLNSQLTKKRDEMNSLRKNFWKTVFCCCY